MYIYIYYIHIERESEREMFMQRAVVCCCFALEEYVFFPDGMPYLFMHSDILFWNAIS